LKKVAKISSGILLVLIGIAGLILPIMPGWVFIIPGLIILAEYFRPIRRLVDWAKHKAGLDEHGSPHASQHPNENKRFSLSWLRSVISSWRRRSSREPAQEHPPRPACPPH
jgi:hypothetical protein